MMIDVRGLPYFAYGSNLSVTGMRYRCPAASKLGRARLEDWQLTFRGVADIEHREGGTVEGGLWRVTDHCVRSLDSYEGAPHLYDRRVVTVETAEGPVDAFTYVMVDALELGLPSPGYYRVITDGYRDFGIPKRGLEESVVDLRSEHDRAGVSHYVERGTKRLMAVLEEELAEDEEELDEELDAWLAGMTPATRMFYELDA